MPSHEALPDFQRIQYAFAAHVRDPAGHARPPDVEDRRMAIYRDLFYNNVEGFISSGFPVLCSLFDEAAWHALVRDFFANHHCRTPYFLEISREFLDFLKHERGERDDDPPWLLELAHYEWAELALSISEARLDQNAIDRDGSLLEGRPVLSPTAWILSYRYPVHRIGPNFIPESPGEQPTHLLVYRDQEDEIGFIEINPVTHRLLTLVEADPALTGRQAMEQIAVELNHGQPARVITGGLEIMERLRETGVVLGTRIPESDSPE